MREDIIIADEMHKHKNQEWYEQMKASICTSGWDKRKEQRNMTGYLLGYETDTLLHQMELIDANVPVVLEQPGEQYDTHDVLTPKLLATHAYRRVEKIRLTEVDGEPHLLLRLKKPEPVGKNPGVGIGCGCAP